MIYHLTSISVYQTFMLMIGLCIHMIKTLKPLKSSYRETLIMQNIGVKKTNFLVRGDRDSRATLMPIYGDLYQIKL